MDYSALIGRTITNVFETETYSEQDGIPGAASYFDIIIELDHSELFELGAHEINPWNKQVAVNSFKRSSWEIENDINIIGKKIVKVIHRDSEEYYDGSLTLLLENNLIMEHQTTNGDLLFIHEYDPDDEN